VKSLIMMSIVLLAIAVPGVAARHPDARHGLWRALGTFALLAALYVAYLIFIHPVAFVPHWP
jgi:hypothetical protein